MPVYSGHAQSCLESSFVLLRDKVSFYQDNLYTTQLWFHPVWLKSGEGLQMIGA